MPVQPPIPGSPPQPQAGPQGPVAGPMQGQPPIGSSPATGPVPNKGLEAAGLAKLGVAVRVLEQIVPMLGAGSEAGRDVLQALTKLSKHVPTGSSSPGLDVSALSDLLAKARQMGPQIAQMRSGQPQGGAPGASVPPQLAQMLAGKAA